MTGLAVNVDEEPLSLVNLGVGVLAPRELLVHLASSPHADAPRGRETRRWFKPNLACSQGAQARRAGFG